MPASGRYTLSCDIKTVQIKDIIIKWWNNLFKKLTEKTFLSKKICTKGINITKEDTVWSILKKKFKNKLKKLKKIIPYKPCSD